MIRLSEIDKYVESRYQRVFILKGINLEIKQGEFLSIMGPSGSGKSTLLNIIGLLDQASAGTYYFEDEPVHLFNERRKSQLHKEHIGFIFQAYHLIDELTVYENIETPLLYRGVKKKERASLVADMLDRFQIVAKKDLYPDQLSGGQQQLVGIARAIIGRPRLLLADEPTGNLHSGQGEQVMNILRELHSEGMTVVHVTHNETFAGYGSRILHLEDGMIRTTP